MPIYSYLCQSCQGTFDELVRKPDDEPAKCPYCESVEIGRTVTAHGGYAMDSGPASVRPKGAGAFKGAKK
jgi:putative FmdB family regulatory protein